MTAINNLQLGNNAKIMMQFNSRIWRETTNYKSGATGILLDFPAGVQGAGLGAKYRLTTDQAQAPPAMVNDTLVMLEPIFPGVTANYNGLAHCEHGNIDPHLLGAYSQYNIGQDTGFSGIEPVQEGNIDFAGEQHVFQLSRASWRDGSRRESAWPGRSES